MIDMSKSYNLRSSGKRKELKCYLQQLSENNLPQDFRPEVRLERLKILEFPEQENFTFHLNRDRIVRKESRRSRNKKIFFLCSFAVILFSFFLVYWQNELQICGVIFYRKIKILHNNMRNYFGNIDPYKYKIEKYLTSFMKIQIKQEKLKKPSLDDNYIDAFNKMEIKDLVKTYMAASYSENDTSEISVTHNENQCRMESESILIEDFSKRKYKFYNATYFESGSLTDYALASQGAKIVNIFDTEPYGVFSVKFFNYDFGPFLNYVLLDNMNSFSRNGPASILIPWQKPGDCWAFKGSRGKVQIQLSQKVIITAVTIDHIPRNMCPDKNVLSAPKRFSVYGIVTFNDQTARHYLGSFEYKCDGPPMQTFSVDSKANSAISNVEFIIESNQGNKIYTCLYKIRVHGYI